MEKNRFQIKRNQLVATVAISLSILLCILIGLLIVLQTKGSAAMDVGSRQVTQRDKFGIDASHQS